MILLYIEYDINPTYYTCINVYLQDQPTPRTEGKPLRINIFYYSITNLLFPHRELSRLTA